MKTTQVSTDEWTCGIFMYMYTHTYKHTRSGILFDNEKEGNPAIFSNMNGPWGYCAKWDKSDRKKTYNVISLLCEILKS